MYTRQRLVDFSDISIKQINDNFSAIFLKLSGNIDTIDLKDNSITTAKVVDGAITADKIAVGAITIGHIDDGFVEGLELLENPVFSSYAEQLQIIDGHVENHATLIQQNASEINLQSIAIDGLGTDLANLSIRADEISSTVQNNKEYVDNQIVLIDDKFASVENTISNQWSSINQRADSIETTVSNVSTTVTSNYNELTGEIDSINTEVGYNYSQIKQLATQITSKVSYTDYNGVEIASLINQEAGRITLDARAIDLKGVTSIHSARYPNDDYLVFYGNGVDLYENRIRRLSIYYDGLTNVIGDGPDIMFPDGVRFTGNVDFSDAYLYGLDVDVPSDVVRSYYDRYRFYLDYDNGNRIYVRDRYGDIVGYLPIA